MREVRYWHSKPFRQTYGRDASWKGFPKQDPDGCYLTMGYRIRLDDGQPETGEPSPVPSASARAAPALPRRPLRQPAPETAPQLDLRPEKAAPRASYRSFGHGGGFDGFEGRMATSGMAMSGPAETSPSRTGGQRPKSGYR
ncbi:hypothetical protein J2X36_001236 [Methylobacterium sp. BE186]|uniref:hypothetical protein n=1 Tax=Methylobacterium sp. BE186 TaxID=2817715 RepID=UPI00285697E5|nr:hypothetical protein [Methylobacterium sp. BE186]MDR7036495.1 hypothetical protein [Methylobacterium sp. BE186]